MTTFRSSTVIGLAMIAFTGAAACAQTAAKPSPFQDQKTLTGTAARAMVDACRAFALKNKMDVTIVVLDAHGDILDLHRMDGAHLQAFRRPSPSGLRKAMPHRSGSVIFPSAADCR